MLKTHLNTMPYTKFVLIEDCVTAKGGDLLEYLIKNHEKRTDYRTHYYIFERNFNRVKEKRTNSQCYDFTTDSRNWLNQCKDLKGAINDLKDNCVVVIDSVVHVLYRYGTSETYKIINELKNKPNVMQIVSVLHTDLLEDRESTPQCFQHLTTLHLELDPKRVSYTFKKGPRKIIKQIEEYHFENGRLITEAIKKPDKEVIEATINKTIPENLSTFKISLSDKDKESRNNLVLPYLPKETPETDSAIHYSFDNVDDWDEEDPDDDLDI